MSGLPPFSLSHVGMYVHDMERMLEFYTKVMGFVVTDRGRAGEAAIVFASQDERDHHQIVLVEGRDRDPASRVINQISFRVPSLEDVQALYRRVRAAPGASDLQPRTHGNAWSIYFRDPEGNRLEVFCDTDWYVSQPCGEPLDLDKPAEQIRRETEALCRGLPGFAPIDEWRAAIAGRIRAARAALPA